MFIPVHNLGLQGYHSPSRKPSGNCPRVPRKGPNSLTGSAPYVGCPSSSQPHAHLHHVVCCLPQPLGPTESRPLHCLMRSYPWSFLSWLSSSHLCCPRPTGSLLWGAPTKYLTLWLCLGCSSPTSEPQHPSSIHP